MSSSTQAPSRSDGVIGAIGIVILLIGTVIGNAYVMLALSVVALAVFAVFFRHRWSLNTRLAIGLAAVVAMVAALAVTKMM